MPELANSGRPALISGAGSGIGRAIALELGKRGHPLVLWGRRVEPLRATLRDAGGSGEVRSVDVRDAEAVQAAASDLESAGLAPTVVVPAAGVAHVAPFAELPPEKWRDAIETNLLGALNLYRVALPHVLASRGHLFAILSIAARRGFPNWSTYSASKWGLRGAFECLREELAGSGVRLTAIYPGATASRLWDGVPGTWDRSAMIAPEEVARTIVWALESAGAVEEIQIRPRGGDL